MKKGNSSSLNFLRLANHALRTPLTAVSGALTLLEAFSEVDEEQQKELISKASIRSKESSRITADMLVIAEAFLETRKQTLRESDLKALLLESFEGFDLVLEYPATPISVLVGERDFVNAVQRAVESSSRWGRVKVCVEYSNRIVTIKIFDEGPLIDQTMSELFEDFEPFKERAIGMHSLSHVYCYALLAANDAALSILNLDGKVCTEIRLETL